MKKGNQAERSIGHVGAQWFRINNNKGHRPHIHENVKMKHINLHAKLIYLIHILILNIKSHVSQNYTI